MHTAPQPWYRQFWPWVLILLPGTAVVASVYTLVIANIHSDDLVVDEYYKVGLAINRQLVRQQTAESLGIAASIRIDDRKLTARVEGTETLTQLRLRLSHPMEANRDLQVALTQIEPGYYTTQLPLAITGRWHWILDAGDGSTWRLDAEQRF
jgi:hypothetical protein